MDKIIKEIVGIDKKASNIVSNKSIEIDKLRTELNLSISEINNDIKIKDEQLSVDCEAIDKETEKMIIHKRSEALKETTQLWKMYEDVKYNKAKKYFTEIVIDNINDPQ